MAKKRIYGERMITPSSGGFGEWDTGEFVRSAQEEEADLVQEARENIGEIFELGVDELPEEIEDIRGRIHNQPPRVFGWIDKRDGSVGYFGIDYTEEKC